MVTKIKISVNIILSIRNRTIYEKKKNTKKETWLLTLLFSNSMSFFPPNVFIFFFSNTKSIFYLLIRLVNLPIKRAATMNVGAGQYQSSNVAITMLPIMPPNLAATIEIATPVALKNRSSWLSIAEYMRVNFFFVKGLAQTKISGKIQL